MGMFDTRQVYTVHVKIAQQIDIQNLLGTDLYNKISADIIADSLTGDYLTLVNTYVQPCLIWFCSNELHTICSLYDYKQICT